jgi:2-dehydro-3-deoxyphosphooctonate aldolase (KDO 8-P synthase)
MTLYQQLQQQPFLIAGPCAIESETLVLEVAQELAQIQQQYPEWKVVFKASFDKANRTSVTSFRGPGLEKGLRILAKVKAETGLPLLTDIHQPAQAAPVAVVVDILQIPAFLCRQTDLLLAAAETGAIINVKKAQFLSAQDMQHVLGKITSTNHQEILLTERGTMFGFNNLVVDYTGVLDMQNYGYPVVMDATHAIQKPGGSGGKSGGNRTYAPFMAKAAAAIGVRGFFVETHPHPEEALCDGPNMIRLADIPALVSSLDQIIRVVS